MKKIKLNKSIAGGIEKAPLSFRDGLFTHGASRGSRRKKGPSFLSFYLGESTCVCETP